MSTQIGAVLVNFTDSEVSKFYNGSFINLKIDAEKGSGIKFAKTYDVEVYPTYFFLDGNGDVIYSSRGGKSKSDFLRLGEMAQNPDYHPDHMIKVFEAGRRDKEFLARCLTVFNDNLKSKENGKILDAYYQLGYFKNEDEMLKMAEKYLSVLDNNFFEQLNKLGREQPEKQHYLKITINKVVNNYIMFNNDLSKARLDNILSRSILDEKTREKISKKAEIMKKIKFGAQ